MRTDDEPFGDVLGNTVELRLLEHLLATPKLDFNVTELARAVEVSRPSTNSAVKKFVSFGIAKVVSRRGNMNFYAINEDDPMVGALYRFSDALIDKEHPRTDSRHERVTETVQVIGTRPKRVTSMKKSK